MNISKKINLRPGEEIVEIVRSAFVLSVFGYFIGLIILLATSFFFSWLASYGNVGMGVIIFGLCLGVLVILRAWLKRRYNYWIVTNQRVVDIDRLGLFDKVISEIWFAEMGDIYFRKKGILAMIFNYADIIIESGGEQFVLEAKRVSSPEKFIAWLKDLKDDYEEIKETENHSKVFKNFIKIIQFLSEEELDEVSVRVQDRLKEMSSSDENDDE